MRKTPKDRTPKSRIVSALRNLFLMSVERKEALKRDKYTCQNCGRKQSKASGKEFKVQVHHKDEIQNWELVVGAIYEYLLCHPDGLQTLCKKCHDDVTHALAAKSVESQKT